jgi:hypothetical protein
MDFSTALSEFSDPSTATSIRFMLHWVGAHFMFLERYST